MNNGSKAEKENTPNEANLQEEEVRNGSVPGRYLCIFPGNDCSPQLALM